LPGVTSGVSPAAYKYYNRNIRFSHNDPLVKVARHHGYIVEPSKNLDGTFNRNTMVVSFPCEAPEGAVIADDMNVIDQIENIVWLQTHWADNSVSSTVYYDEGDLPDIQHWLDMNYNEKIKTISFLPKVHGFAQAPFEEITEAQYNATKKEPISSTKLGNTPMDMDCGAGGCPVR